MADVFISYKREDRPRAEDLATISSEAGLSVFFDANIDVGEHWDRRIENELTTAKAVAVLWSRRSIESDWVRVEARAGKSRGILCPGLIENVQIPLEFSSIQGADLRDWKGEPGHQECLRLVARLRACVSANVPQPSTVIGDNPLSFRFPVPNLRALYNANLPDLVASVPGEMDPGHAFIAILMATYLSEGELSQIEEAEEWGAILQRSRTFRALPRDKAVELQRSLRDRLEQDYVFTLADACKSLPSSMAESVFANVASLLVVDGAFSEDAGRLANTIAGLLNLEKNAAARALGSAVALSRY